MFQTFELDSSSSFAMREAWYQLAVKHRKARKQLLKRTGDAIKPPIFLYEVSYKASYIKMLFLSLFG